MAVTLRENENCLKSRKKEKKEYQEKSERTGPFGIFKKKRKKDAEDDVWGTEEEGDKQKELDGQEIVRIPYTPIEGTDEVLSSSDSKPTDLSASNQEKQQQVTSQETETTENQQEQTVDDEQSKPSWPFVLSNITDDEDDAITIDISTDENSEVNVLVSASASTSKSNTIIQENNQGNNIENQLLQTIIAQNEKMDKLLESLKNGGKLIFPKKYPLGAQKLVLLEKINTTKYSHQTLFDVRFVPLLKKIL